MREESIPDEVPALFGAKVATEVLLSQLSLSFLIVISYSTCM